MSKIFASNSYQMLDFRVGSRKGAKNLPIKAKRSLSKYVLPNLVRRTNSVQGTLAKEVVMVDSEKKAEEKQNQEPDLPYVFTPNKMPIQKQLFYQVCDLHDPEIQRLLSRNDGQVNYYNIHCDVFFCILFTYLACVPYMY